MGGCASKENSKKTKEDDSGFVLFVTCILLMSHAWVNSTMGCDWISVEALCLVFTTVSTSLSTHLLFFSSLFQTFLYSTDCVLQFFTIVSRTRTTPLLLRYSILLTFSSRTINWMLLLHDNYVVGRLSSKFTIQKNQLLSNTYKYTTNVHSY